MATTKPKGVPNLAHGPQCWSASSSENASFLRQTGSCRHRGVLAPARRLCGCCSSYCFEWSSSLETPKRLGLIRTPHKRGASATTLQKVPKTLYSCTSTVFSFTSWNLCPKKRPSQKKSTDSNTSQAAGLKRKPLIKVHRPYFCNFFPLEPAVWTFLTAL